MSGSNSPPSLTVVANGAGFLADAQLNTLVQGGGVVVSTLRAFPALNGMVCWLIGYSVANDGGQGMFVYNSSSTATDDGGQTCIAPNGILTGRWLRQSLGNLVTATGQFTNTAVTSTFTVEVNGLTPAQAYGFAHGSGVYTTIGIFGGVNIPSTATVDEADGGFFAVQNSSSTTQGVAILAIGSGNASGANTFGMNIVVNDGPSGAFAGGVISIEADNGGFSTGSTVINYNAIGSFPNGTPATATAFQVSVLDYPWGTAFQVFDGAAEQGMYLGSLTTTANSDGCGISMAARDNSNTRHLVAINSVHTASGANLEVTTPNGGFVCSAASVVAGLATFDAAIAVTAASTNLESFYSGSTAVGSISTNGTTTAYNTTSDHRLKDLDGASDGAIVGQLKVYTGSFKAAPAVKRSMFLAHEVQAVAPHAVTGTKDETYDADVIATRGRIIHKKGDLRTEDETAQEFQIVLRAGDPYPDDVLTATGIVIHKKGEICKKAIHKTVAVVVNAKGTPYDYDVWGSEEYVRHAKGDPKPQMIDHSALMPDVVAYIQSLEKRIAALEANK